MAKAKTKTTEATAAAAPIAAMMAINPAAAAAWNEVLTHSTAFVNARMTADQELPGRLMSCKTPVEVMEVQTEFYSKAFKDYSENSAQMAQLVTKATETTFKEMMSGHSRAYDDVPV